MTLARDELTIGLFLLPCGLRGSVEEVVEQDHEVEGKGVMPTSVPLDKLAAHLGMGSRSLIVCFDGTVGAVRLVYSKGDIEKTMNVLGLIEGLNATIARRGGHCRGGEYISQYL